MSEFTTNYTYKLIDSIINKEIEKGTFDENSIIKSAYEVEENTSVKDYCEEGTRTLYNRFNDLGISFKDSHIEIQGARSKTSQHEIIDRCNALTNLIFESYQDLSIASNNDFQNEFIREFIFTHIFDCTHDDQVDYCSSYFDIVFACLRVVVDHDFRA